MSETFDNKVYEIIKAAATANVSNEILNITFNTFYPVGSLITNKTGSVPITNGTWKLVGMYGLANFTNNNVQYNVVFNNQYAIVGVKFDNTVGSNSFDISITSLLGSNSIKAIIGTTYKNDNTYTFFDDSGNWSATLKGNDTLTISANGLSSGRKYEFSYLTLLDDLITTSSKCTTFPIAYEFERTE